MLVLFHSFHFHYLFFFSRASTLLFCIIAFCVCVLRSIQMVVFFAPVAIRNHSYPLCYISHSFISFLNEQREAIQKKNIKKITNECNRMRERERGRGVRGEA